MDESSHPTTLPHEHSQMTHSTLNISADGAPTVDLIVHTDPKSGWNLQINTTNFLFAPEHASTQHIDGEGHAHLYIDGTKITRLYNEWYHIPELSKGKHTLMVSLNTNTHDDYVVSGIAISDTEIIVVQ